MEKRLTVVNNTKEGKTEVLTGSSFHVLEGKAETQFNTNIISEFVRCVETLEGVCVYYDESSLVAFPNDLEYDEREAAKCKLENSLKLNTIISYTNQNVKLKDFEEFLLSMKKSMDKNGMDLLDKVKSFKISKTTEIVRQKDHAGNYIFSVKRENAGKEDVVFPETISFEVLLFKYHDYTIHLEFDVYFDFVQADDNVVILFNLRNYELDDFIQDRKKTVLMEEIKAIKHPYYWGELKTLSKTDQWKYLSNSADK